jgi:hypothetical protein
MATAMPAKGHSSAPKFSGEPADLDPYFEELELLLGEHNITVERDRIKHATRYIDTKEAASWKTLSEFEGGPDPNHPNNQVWDYAAFKVAVFELYPGAEMANVVQVTRADLEKLIRKRASVQITERGELGSFHREFQVMGKRLVSKQYMSENEVNFAYMRAFDGSDGLRKRLEARLDALNPNRDLNLPIARASVFKEADRLLAGNASGVAFVPVTANASAPSTQYTMPAPTIVQQQPVMVKQEDLSDAIKSAFGAYLASLGPQAFANVPMGQPMQQSQRGAGYGPSNSQAPQRTQQQPLECYMCGGLHRINNCDVIPAYVQNGKAIVDQNNRVKLPGGGDIPQGLPGRFMMEKIDAWHFQNPNQRANPAQNSQGGSQQAQASSNFFGMCGEQASHYMYAQADGASSSARIEELVDVEDDPVTTALENKLGKLKEGDPLIAVFEAAIADRREAVAEGVAKPARVSERANKGRQAVKFADEQHEGKANEDLRNRPAPRPIREETPERESSPPPAPIRKPMPKQSEQSSHAPTRPQCHGRLYSARATSYERIKRDLCRGGSVPRARS